MAKSSSGLMLHGIPVMSINEFYVGTALDKAKVPYEYQYQVGQYKALGSQAADFYLGAPLNRILQVQGDYWHGGSKSAESILKAEQLQSKSHMPVDQIWGHECNSQATADAWVSAHYGAPI